MLSSGARAKDTTSDLIYLRKTFRKPLPQVIFFGSEGFRIRVDETGYFLYAVLAYPDLCGRGKTVLLQVQ